ncbi:MAG: (Fe-S)-binding protein [Dehalococcoidia bacterium]
MAQASGIRASLFVTCIVDQLYPQVGVSVVRVLRRLGVAVDFPSSQTCCGQPLYNSGFTWPAQQLARRVLQDFSSSRYIVVPSGSCAAMMRVFFLDLFEDDPDLRRHAQDLAGRIYEFSEFLTDVLQVDTSQFRYSGVATYHSSCHLLRELEVRDQPVNLLQQVSGLTLVDLPQAETCCGFGGTFSVKYPHISQEMLTEKMENIRTTGADTLVSCDMSCLMHLGGGLSRQGSDIKIRHLAQVLDPEAE